MTTTPDAGPALDKAIAKKLNYWPHYHVPPWSTDLSAAWEFMERYGLALIPQSRGDGFAWLCCDLVSVAYGGETITLNPEAAMAVADTPAHAIALTVLRILEAHTP